MLRALISLITAFLLLLSVGSLGPQAVLAGANLVPPSVDKTVAMNPGPADTWTLNLSSELTSNQLPEFIQAGETLKLSLRLYGPDTQVQNPWRHEEGYQLWSDEQSWEVSGSRFLAYPDFLYSLEGAPNVGTGEMEAAGADPNLPSTPRPDYGGLLEIELRAKVDSPAGLRLTTEGSSPGELDTEVSSRTNRNADLTPAGARTLVKVGELDPVLQRPLDLNAIIKPPARVGTFKPLVVLVDFPDNTANASSTRNFYQNRLFATSGISMTTFFMENSWNQLNLQGNVVWNQAGTAWVRTTTTYAWYMNNQAGAGAYPQNTQGLTEDILNLIDPYVNFQDYDGNGDGEIDGLMVIYAGYADCTDSARIWPHKWSISTQVRDGIQISDYCMQPEYESTPLDTGLSVYCHEYSHVLGAYDLYDYDYTSAGVGTWSLMAWDNKQHLDPWSKSLLGWITPTVQSSNATGLLIPAVETTKLVYRLNLGDPSEYYLVENRANLGYDQNLPGWGVLIWHVDEEAVSSGRINNNEWHPPDHIDSGHYTVAVEQADSLYQLEKQDISATGIEGYVGNAGDPFISGSSFTPITNPSSCDYQGRNWNIQITNISAPGVSVTADFSFNLTNRVITWWPLRTGNLSFLLQGSANPNGVSTQAWFEWGTTTAYGSTTSPIALGSGTVPQAFTVTFPTPAVITSYHFRAICQNSAGTFYGKDWLLAPSGTWTNLNPANSPPARSSRAMVYDTARGKVILFGGQGSSGYLNETWAYDPGANSWTNLNPANPPPARWGHAMVYDSARGKVILFGGFGSSGYLNDTWSYDPGINAWTDLNPSNPPYARCSHSMVFDSARGKVILFGGTSIVNEIWSYDPLTNAWTNRVPSNPPLLRTCHAMVYDSARGKVILFGGQGATVNVGYLNDTWAYDPGANSWVNLNPANPPPARRCHAMVYDTARGKVILFGGCGNNSFNDIWTYDYDTNAWTNRNPYNPPPARMDFPMAYDSQSGKVILFGGWGKPCVGHFDDTWTYDYGEDPPAPSTGAIIVNATLNGSAWSGSVSYSLSGPASFNGSAVPSTFSNQPTGSWTLGSVSGGPSGATLSSITPAATQTLSSGGTITYTLNFSSLLEILYDDDDTDAGWAKVLAGNGFAVRMTPPAGTSALQTVSFRFWGTDWPNPGATPFQWEIWNATGGGGAPGSKIAGPYSATANRGGWTSINTSGLGITVSGDFYVLYKQIGDYPYCPGLATDADGPFYGRSWSYQDGAWMQWPETNFTDYGGKFMIRATVLPN